MAFEFCTATLLRTHSLHCYVHPRIYRRFIRAYILDPVSYRAARWFVMITFIMLTRLATGTPRSAENLEELERSAIQQVESRCSDVRWLSSYAVLGRSDYVDIFEAPDIETAMKVSAVIRTFGHADTEVWPAVDWQRFKTIARSLQT